MPRKRGKYKLAIIVSGRDECGPEAQELFVNFVDYINSIRPAGNPVKTEPNRKQGDQKYDEFTIILK